MNRKDKFLTIDNDLLILAEESGISPLIIMVDGFKLTLISNRLYLKVKDVSDLYKKEILKVEEYPYSQKELLILRNNEIVFSKYLNDFESGNIEIVER